MPRTVTQVPRMGPIAVAVAQAVAMAQALSMTARRLMNLITLTRLRKTTEQPVLR